MFPYKKIFTYNGFLQNILDKKLTGLIVVKDLEIKKDNQNPCFGFIIPKAQYETKRLSDYTQKRLSRFSTGQKVVSLHKSSSFMVLSMDYFLWLHNTFGFEKNLIYITPFSFNKLIIYANILISNWKPEKN